MPTAQMGHAEDEGECGSKADQEVWIKSRSGRSKADQDAVTGLFEGEMPALYSAYSSALPVQDVSGIHPRSCLLHTSLVPARLLNVAPGPSIDFVGLNR